MQAFKSDAIEALMHQQIRGTPWRLPQPVNVTATISEAPPRGSNPLQDSYIRLDHAEQLRKQGKLDRAQKICETLLREHPDYVAGLHTLGLVYADKRNYQQALNCLVRAVMLNPRSWSTLTILSGIYLELDAPEMAALTLEQARAINPRDVNVLVTLGEIYRKEREYELARDAYARALEIEPTFGDAAAGLGWSCSYLGEDVEAIARFEGLLKSSASEIEILIALASLPPSLVTIDLLAEAEKFARDHDDKKDADFESLLAFVRVGALDRAGQRNHSWEEALRANRKVHQEMKQDLHDMSERCRVTMAALRHASLTAATSTDASLPTSLFILGPSRSGKTTMERLVATLDGAKRGYENPSVDIAIRRAFQTAGLLTNNFFEVLPPELYPLCRDIYVEELKRRAGPAKVFTNTHPGRIYDAALMASVFPDVRFLFMKRNVDDTVLRMFQRRYREGNSYAYDVKTAREFVAWYHEMIDLMAAKFPARVRIVHYEEMVTNPSDALRVAADLCGLPMPVGPLPAIGDDRNCAAPYRQLMAEALAP
jgi:tetratricopeptide (TPR) repeat protein